MCQNERIPFWIFFEKDDVEYDSDPDDSWVRQQFHLTYKMYENFRIFLLIA